MSFKKLDCLGFRKKGKCICLVLLFALCQITAQQKPNVILILTDDQGIGDLGCQGNPWLKTPNIDAFYKESVRMTDFHVSPYCAPTRSAIMTGKLVDKLLVFK
jgi:arylsulfatase A-like enzyme